MAGPRPRGRLSQGNKLKKATPWAVGGSVITAGSTFLSTLIVARLLEPRDFGLAATAIAVPALIVSLIISPFNQSLVRAPSTDSETLDKVLSLLLVLGGLGVAASFGTALVTSWLGSEPRLFWLTSVAGLDCLLIAIATIPNALHTRKMRTRLFALRTLTYKAVSIAVTLFLAFGQFGPWSLVLGILAGDLASCFVLWRSQLRRPRWRWPDRSMRDMASMSFWISAEQGLGSIAVRGFVILFGQFHGLDALGYLNFAVRLVDEAGNLIATTVTKVAFAFFSAIERSGQSHARAFLMGTHAIMLVATPMLLGIAGVAPDLVPMLFGPKWAPAVFAVQVISFFWALRMSRLLAPAVLRAIGIQRTLASNALVGLIATVVALLATARAPVAVAIATYGVRTLVTLPLGLGQIARLAKIPARDQIGVTLKPFAAALVMFASITLLRQSLLEQWDAWTRLAVTVPVGALIYLTFIAAFDRTEALKIVQWWRTK